jgi:hypothetical protein
MMSVPCYWRQQRLITLLLAGHGLVADAASVMRSMNYASASKIGVGHRLVLYYIERCGVRGASVSMEVEMG